jgi:hypothetical protein
MQNQNNNPAKDQCKFNSSDTLHIPGLDPNHIGYFRRLAAQIGVEEARLKYNGMSKEKAEYLASLDDKMDNYGIKWTVEILKKRYADKKFAPYVAPKPRDDYDDYYDYYDRDEFFGPKDTVTYARWLYNRYGTKKVAKQFHISDDLADRIGTSSLPGSMKVAELETDDDIDEIESEIYARKAAKSINAYQMKQFHNDNSRKLKIRLNKLAENDTAFVLRKLIETEDYNIKAKECYFDYIQYNYDKKSENLVAAIERLSKMDWKYLWADDQEGTASYIFYVVLPTGKQVSWHGMHLKDVENVPKDNEAEWDGELSSTLPKLLDCVKAVCPSIYEEKFDKKKCLAELEKYTYQDSERVQS